MTIISWLAAILVLISFLAIAFVWLDVHSTRKHSLIPGYLFNGSVFRCASCRRVSDESMYDIKHHPACIRIQIEQKPLVKVGTPWKRGVGRGFGKMKE